MVKSVMSPIIGIASVEMNQTISILFSEGSSLSARQALSALGPLGYKIDICDPNPLCLGRFSRFVRHFYRSPHASSDPAMYLECIQELLERNHYDVLLPVHEQAFLFARMQGQLRRKAGLALPEFKSFSQLQSKAAFARLLDDLGLPHPKTQFIHSKSELMRVDSFPCYVKMPYGTAGSDVWRINNVTELRAVAEKLVNRGALDEQMEILVQAVAPGILSQAQAVFEQGRLIAVHSTSEWVIGVGGSQSARLSVDHPIVRQHLELLGRHLNWHGAMALDYLYDPANAQPAYIEANPRLVEPMNAVLSGVNLADIVVRLSLGESFADKPVRQGHFDIQSHSMMAILLGLAASGGRRIDLVRTMAQVVFKRQAFANSKEDLTLVEQDLPSIIPLTFVVLQLLASPAKARRIADKAIADYSLSPNAIALICGIGG